MLKLYSEVEGFLGFAIIQMNKRRDETGRYPKSWEMVIPSGISYSDGTWGSSAKPAGRPAPRQGATWKPMEHHHKSSSHTYTIVCADERTFQIDAVDDWGRTTWTATQQDEDPVQLLPMYCTSERVSEEEEPREFLRRAAHGARKSARYAKPFPTTWAEVESLHWSNEDHFRGDVRSRPPADAAQLWRPQGSRYTYELIANGSTGAFRSYNEHGLKNYMILSTEYEPTELP